MSAAPLEHDGDPSASPSSDFVPAPATVEAAPMSSKVFPSWDAFAAYVAAYQHETFQVFRSKTSTSVATRNQRIAALNAKKYGLNATIPDDRTMPAELGVYSKQLVCTHEGKPRSRGKGVRRQSLRATDCPATINALAKRRQGGDSSKVSGWQVVITRHVPFHNHPLDRHTFMAFSRTFAPRPESAVALSVEQGASESAADGCERNEESAQDVGGADTAGELQVARGSTVQAGLPAGTQNVEVQERSATPESAPGGINASSMDRRRPLREAHEVSSGGFTLRPPRAGSPKAVLHPVTQNAEVQATPESAPGGTSARDMERLQLLREADEVSSGSFKLRMKRLEEQNLALYKQNCELHKLNQEYMTDLKRTREKAIDQHFQLVALHKSETKLTDKVKALEQEVERLKAESTLWELQAQAQNSPNSSSQASKRPSSSNNESSRARKRRGR